MRKLLAGALALLILAGTASAGVATVNTEYGVDGVSLSAGGAAESIGLTMLGAALGFGATRCGGNDVLSAVLGTAALISFGVGLFGLLGHNPLLVAMLAGVGIWYYLRA